MRFVALSSLWLAIGLAHAARGQDAPVPVPAAQQAEAKEDAVAAKKERQIQLKVVVVEYSRDKLRRIGVDITERFGKQEASDGLAPFLAYMRQNNFLITFAEPKLVTTNGQPAHFDGPTRFGQKLGTELTFTPTLLGEGRVRLNLHTVTTEVDRKSFAANRRSMKPSFKTVQTDRDFELNLGSTVFCPGRVMTDVQEVWEIDARGRRTTTTSPVENQMLYIVTPELVAAKE